MKKTKRRITFFLTVMMLLLLTVSSIGWAANNIPQSNSVITINNATYSNVPTYINSDSRTMVPVRFVAEALNSHVNVESSTRKVTISRDHTTINLWIGKFDYTIGMQLKNMDTAPRLVSPPGTTYVPLRFVAQALGADVDWSQRNNINYITISDNQAASQPEQDNDFVNLTEDEQEMMKLVNYVRTDRGLPPLMVDYNLVKVARLKSRDMIKHNYFDHQSPTYGSPFEMMDLFDIDYNLAAGPLHPSLARHTKV